MRWLLLLLLSFQLHARTMGGVDVGNGHVVVGFDTPGFKLEHDLQTYAEDQIFSIQEGVHPDVLALAMKGECATNGVQIKGLEVQKYFPIDVVRKFSMSRYKGHYIVELFQCKRPERIKKPEYSRFN
jgi:hypothetical protein